MLTARTLTVSIKDAHLNPIENVRCEFRLSGLDAETSIGHIKGGAIENPATGDDFYLTDVDGEAQVLLYPNALAQAGTYYELTSYHPLTEEPIHRRFQFQMPDQNADLEDIAPITPDNPAVGAGGGSGGSGGAGENNPAQITNQEIIDGDATEIRSFSPADAVAILAQHISAHIDLSDYSTSAEVTSEITGAISAAIASLVDSSPATLDTLNELAAALGDDPNFAATVTNQLAAMQTSVTNAEASVATLSDEVDAVEASVGGFQASIDAINPSLSSIIVTDGRGLGADAAGSSVGHIVSPGGGAYRSTGNETGKIRIRLPQWYLNTFFSMSVRIYDYSLRGAIDVVCSGYALGVSTDAWQNVSARIHTDHGIAKELPVTFGDDGNKVCIEIGAADTEWHIAQILVHDVLIGGGSNDAADYINGWLVSITDSALSNVSSVLNDNQVVSLSPVTQAEIDAGVGDTPRSYTVDQLMDLITQHAGTHAPVTSSGSDPS